MAKLPDFVTFDVAHVTDDGLQHLDPEVRDAAAATTEWVCVGVDEDDGTELWAPASGVEGVVVRAPDLAPGSPS